MRALFAAVVALALIAGALFVIDLGVTAAAEERVAERVSEEIGAPADVTIAGWPVTVRTLASGQVPRVEVHTTDVPANGGTIDRLTITLIGVAFDLDDVRNGSGELPPAEEARFEAALGQESLQGLLRLPAGVLDLSMADGVVVLDVAGLATVEAHVGASDGVVIVLPDSPEAALVGLDRIPVDLSGQPGRPYVEEAEIAGGLLLLRGRLEEFRIGSG